MHLQEGRRSRNRAIPGDDLGTELDPTLNRLVRRRELEIAGTGQRQCADVHVEISGHGATGEPDGIVRPGTGVERDTGIGNEHVAVRSERRGAPSRSWRHTDRHQVGGIGECRLLVLQGLVRDHDRVRARGDRASRRTKFGIRHVRGRIDRVLAHLDLVGRDVDVALGTEVDAADRDGLAPARGRARDPPVETNRRVDHIECRVVAEQQRDAIAGDLVVLRRPHAEAVEGRVRVGAAVIGAAGTADDGGAVDDLHRVLEVVDARSEIEVPAADAAVEDDRVDITPGVQHPAPVVQFVRQRGAQERRKLGQDGIDAWCRPDVASNRPPWVRVARHRRGHRNAIDCRHEIGVASRIGRDRRVAGNGNGLRRAGNRVALSDRRIGSEHVRRPRHGSHSDVGSRSAEIAAVHENVARQFLDRIAGCGSPGDATLRRNGRVRRGDQAVAAACRLGVVRRPRQFGAAQFDLHVVELAAGSQRCRTTAVVATCRPESTLERDRHTDGRLSGFGGGIADIDRWPGAEHRRGEPEDRNHEEAGEHHEGEHHAEDRALVTT